MSTKNNNNNTGGLPKFRIKRINNNEDNNNYNNNNISNNTLQKFYKKNKSKAEFLVNLLEAPQPEILITKLFPYQKQGLDWMLSNEHSKELTIDEEV
ncbi:hypothetical protein C1646_751207 [Rhizophagus diaphanus]|nr:hypothetical protein C1646_751207 [Rhizophagus diaphanus] [Rhizophagus sp. MUCL 43196]